MEILYFRSHLVDSEGRQEVGDVAKTSKSGSTSEFINNNKAVNRILIDVDL